MDSIYYVYDAMMRVRGAWLMGCELSMLSIGLSQRPGGRVCPAPASPGIEEPPHKN